MGEQLRQASLLFLVEEDNVWLGMKKRGFGVGLWNGIGGKPEPNEPIEETAVRECQEEILVTPYDLEHVATLDFFFPSEKAAWNQQVVVYFSGRWDGEPSETEEMSPKKFPIDSLPFEEMWDDDKIWLPKVIGGMFVTAEFRFDNSSKIIDYQIDERPRK